jgi:hypothetical protein
VQQKRISRTELRKEIEKLRDACIANMMLLNQADDAVSAGADARARKFIDEVKKRVVEADT